MAQLARRVRLVGEMEIFHPNAKILEDLFRNAFEETLIRLVQLDILNINQKISEGQERERGKKTDRE